MQLADVMRKTAVLWLSGSPLWHVWHEGAAYVVGGGLEQPLPEWRHGRVTVRTKNGDVLAWGADVQPVPVGSPDWDAVVPLLHAKRLNAPDGEQQPARWARESTVLRLTPTGP
ncbi:MAG: hypothetical protein ABR614_07560 [Mycobacteriales bacterium]